MIYPFEMRYSAARSSPDFPSWLCRAIGLILKRRIYEDSAGIGSRGRDKVQADRGKTVLNRYLFKNSYIFVQEYVILYIMEEL